MIGIAAMLAVAAPASKPAAVPPEARPAWIGRTVRPEATEQKAQSYVVRPGDTLGHVVLRTGAGADAIVRANDLDPPYRLRPGQTLRIPAGRYHRVGPGESGIAIARAYGVEWREIADLNHIVEPSVLREGQRLLIPSTRKVAGMTMEQRARAFTIDLDDLVTGSEPALAVKAKPAAPARTAARTLSPGVPVEQPKGAFAGRFVWPVKGRVTRMFGPLAIGGRNQGIDIAARPAQPILAGADGVVAYAAEYSSFGRVVLLRHAGGWISLYAHVGDIVVKRGQAVTAGQPIARVDRAGELHFEIRDGRRAVNPIDRLPDAG